MPRYVSPRHDGSKPNAPLPGAFPRREGERPFIQPSIDSHLASSSHTTPNPSLSLNNPIGRPFSYDPRYSAVPMQHYQKDPRSVAGMSTTVSGKGKKEDKYYSNGSVDYNKFILVKFLNFKLPDNTIVKEDHGWYETDTNWTPWWDALLKSKSNPSILRYSLPELNNQFQESFIAGVKHCIHSYVYDHTYRKEYDKRGRCSKNLMKYFAEDVDPPATKTSTAATRNSPCQELPHHKNHDQEPSGRMPPDESAEHADLPDGQYFYDSRNHVPGSLVIVICGSKCPLFKDEGKIDADKNPILTFTSFFMRNNPELLASFLALPDIEIWCHDAEDEQKRQVIHFQAEWWVNGLGKARSDVCSYKPPILYSENHCEKELWDRYQEYLQKSTQ